MFFVEEPDYPRIMGFRFVQGDAPGMYRYEMYLPGGADELGIVLYDPATFHYVDYIVYRQNVTSGRIKEVISVKQSIKGTYKALIFVKKGKKEDTIEKILKFQ
jgi:minor extracellular serine protease Vpr